MKLKQQNSRRGSGSRPPSVWFQLVSVKMTVGPENTDHTDDQRFFCPGKIASRKNGFFSSLSLLPPPRLEPFALFFLPLSSCTSVWSPFCLLTASRGTRGSWDEAKAKAKAKAATSLPARIKNLASGAPGTEGAEAARTWASATDFEGWRDFELYLGLQSDPSGGNVKTSTSILVLVAKKEERKTTLGFF